MPTRTERIEARIAPDEAEEIRAAARLENLSASGFLVSSAVARAREILARHRETVVPSGYFDELLRSLDEPPEVIPALRAAADLGDAKVSKRAPRRRTA
ncbi:MAG: DUF1778 domain-containing protein [Actinobacteria bacterium]|nr:DUF1778 domain-containing protein [Actinomycetota bacterium]